MIPAPQFAGQTVAILGLGRTGLATARSVIAGGGTPIAWDDGAAARDAAQAEGLTVQRFERAEDFAGIAALIMSPGIAHLYRGGRADPHPAVRAALTAGVPVDNDIGVFFRAVTSDAWEMYDRVPRVIAVTGSNGKSTTAALIDHILRSTGRDCQLAGNIGRAVLDIDPPGDGGVVVLELSSYQTELARALTPDIAVFTNLTQDHLDRHGGMGGYFAAKRRLFAEGGPDRAVIGIDEPEGLFLSGQMAEGPGDERVIRVSVRGKIAGPGWSVHARKGHLSEWRKARQIGAIDLRDIAGLPGAHNHQNACAAYAAVRALGLGPAQIEAAMRSYPGLPHRSQVIGVAGGVRYVNDSKATNADAALQALQAFDRVRWICGGLMKEGGLASLHPALSAVAKAYVIGADPATFAAELPAIPSDLIGDMETAVARAVAEAEPGDVVLLAPAAASQDQYPSFEHRGDAFIAAVRAATGL